MQTGWLRHGRLDTEALQVSVIVKEVVVRDDPLGAHLVVAYEWVAVLDGDDALRGIADVPNQLRGAGCTIEYVAETTPEGKLIESFFDSLAEFYSSQLSVNTTRGMRYNAENAKFNGHRVLGYRKSEDGHYEIDPVTAPVVQRIFAQYAEGKAMTDIIEDLTAQGVRSVNGKKLSVNSLRHILHNGRYLGIYRYADVVIPDGMPQLVD